MNGILNLLHFIEENWASIVAVIGMCVAIYKKAEKTYFDWKAKSEHDKQLELQIAQEKAIKTAKNALAEVVLKYVSDAEIAWRSEGGGLGKIKRSEVIGICFEKFPILLTVTNTQEVMNYIDQLIDQALETVRKTIRTEVETEKAE